MTTEVTIVESSTPVETVIPVSVEEPTTDNEVIIAAIEADKEVAIAEIHADARVAEAEAYNANKENDGWTISQLSEQLTTLTGTVTALAETVASLAQPQPFSEEVLIVEPETEIPTQPEIPSIPSSTPDEINSMQTALSDVSEGAEVEAEIPQLRVDGKPVHVPIIKLV